MDQPSSHNQYHPVQADLLLNSYRRLLGSPLIATDVVDHDDRAQWLFNAPFAVVSHGIEPDPIFNYGNRTALQLFEMPWHDFTQLPSRHSAEAVNRAKRQRLLDAVSEQGFYTGYRGMRISATGRRFWIEQATLWNLVDDQGHYCGQAAAIFNWSPV